MTIDFQNLNVRRIRAPGDMFQDCRKAKGIILQNFNSTSLMNLYGLFLYCNNLKYIDISCMDIRKVTDISDMFYYCYDLAEVKLSGLGTHSVIYMNSVFGTCKTLRRIDLSGFNTSRVKYMKSVFSGCERLEELDPLSFDTRNAEDMSNMFYGCESAKNLIDAYKTACTETRNLSREPDEFNISLDIERVYIRTMNDAPRQVLLLAVVDGEIAGSADIVQVSSLMRDKHRCSLGIMLKNKFTGLGVGTILITELFELAKQLEYEQV